jgi:hypothetical protein
MDVQVCEALVADGLDMPDVRLAQTLPPSISFLEAVPVAQQQPSENERQGDASLWLGVDQVGQCGLRAGGRRW